MFDCSSETFNVQEYDYYGKLEDCSISGGLLCVASSNLKKTEYSVSLLTTKKLEKINNTFFYSFSILQENLNSHPAPGLKFLTQNQVVTSQNQADPNAMI